MPSRNGIGDKAQAGACARGRRALLAAIAALLAVPGTAAAQDPRTTAAQRVARDWLALTDKQDAAASWKAASPRFQQLLPLVRWTALLKSEREPRGTVVQRTAATTSFGTQAPGLPEGTYALVLFRTSFSSEPNGVEQVTLEQGSDGVWRVIGYVVR